MTRDEINKIIVHKFGIKNKPGSSIPFLASHKNRVTLAELFKDLGFKVGVEIGTQLGKYAQVLCDNNPGVKLHCIDPWFPIGKKYPKERQDRYYELTVEKLKPYNVNIIRKTSMDALNDFEDRSLDFIFIDGAHDFDNVCMDLICWVNKVKSGGIISLHDYYYQPGNGVVKAVDAYTSCHHIDPWYVLKNLSPTAFWVNL